MPTIRWKSLVALLYLVAGWPTLGIAQAGPTPLAGEHMQVRIVERATAPISDGDAGSRLAHTALGLVGGAIVGGVIGRISAGDGCVVEGCDDGVLVVRIKTVIGAAVGAVAGAVIGAALPAGRRSPNATSAWPLRVAGLEVHPELRLSFDARRGH